MNCITFSKIASANQSFGFAKVWKLRNLTLEKVLQKFREINWNIGR